MALPAAISAIFCKAILPFVFQDKDGQDGEKLSKKKLRLMLRPSIAELKAVGRTKLVRFVCLRTLNYCKDIHIFACTQHRQYL